MDNKSTNLAEQMRYRALQLQTAAAVSSAVSSILDPDVLLPQMVELIRDRFNLYYVGLFLVSEDGRHAILQAGTGEAGRRMIEAGHRLEVGGQSMIGWCVANGQARIALDVGQEAVRFDNPFLPETRSEIALPLISRGRVIGAMTIQSGQPAAFDQEDITVLQTMADQLANAIENARLFQERERRITELAIVNEIGHALSTSLPLDELLKIVHQQVRRLFDTTNFYIATYEEGSEEWTSALHLEQGQRQPRGHYSIHAGLTGYIIRHRRPLLFRTAEEMLTFARLERVPIIGDPARSWLGVPLLARDRIVGVMGIQNYEHENLYRDSDLTLFSTVGAQVANALENLRLLEETRRRAQELSLRIQELNCLNEIGRKIDESLPVPEFLEWIAERIPPAMQYPNLCRAAIQFEGHTYGAKEAVELPRQMVQTLYLAGEPVGRVYVAYIEEHDFLNEESALLGDIARRINGYIENRRLFEQIHAVLAEVEATHRSYLHRTWQEHLRQQEMLHRSSFVYDRQQTGPLTITPAPDFWRPEMEQALIQASPAIAVDDREGRVGLAVPIVLRGETIGVLGAEAPDDERQWTEDEIALMQAIGEQLGQTLEGARLFADTQRRAERERLIGEITAKIRSSTDMRDILEITARELGQALAPSRVLVRVGTEGGGLPHQAQLLSVGEVPEKKEAL